MKTETQVKQRIAEIEAMPTYKLAKQMDDLRGKGALSKRELALIATMDTLQWVLS